MTTALNTQPTAPTALATVAAVADTVANDHTLTQYQNTLAHNTRTAQRGDLALWSQYLAQFDASLAFCDWYNCLDCWRGVSHGLVVGFVQWLLTTGRTTASVNRALTTVKTYCKLANSAGIIDADTYTRVKNVTGLHGKAARNVDALRNQTRYSEKKAEWTRVTPEQLTALQTQPNTPQGRRDAVIVACLAELGLRVGELASLRTTDINLQDGTITFYREKVHKTQTHELGANLWRALLAYITNDKPSDMLLLGSNKSGKLTGGMTAHSIIMRVGVLGSAVGLHKLTPHDLRHVWATRAATSTPTKALQDAGGWSSLAMPMRYVDSAKIANAGVVLAKKW